MRWGHMLDFLLRGCWVDATFRIVRSLSVFIREMKCLIKDKKFTTLKSNFTVIKF